MRYKIILSNTKETITIREEELEKVLMGISSGSPVIIIEGIFNPSYFVAIIQDNERMKTITEAKNQNSEPYEPSPFAKLLSKKSEMLTPPERTLAQEEASALARPSGK